MLATIVVVVQGEHEENKAMVDVSILARPRVPSHEHHVKPKVEIQPYVPLLAKNHLQAIRQVGHLGQNQRDGHNEFSP